uniref:Lipoprotein n=1 Tax=Paenibacillus polymyxa TaxID=1406 RepID=A0AAE9L7F9_PAEPO
MHYGKKVILYLVISIITVGLLSACGHPQSVDNQVPTTAKQMNNENPKNVEVFQPVKDYLEAIKKKDSDVALSLLANKSSIPLEEFRQSVESSSVSSFTIVDNKKMSDDTYKVLTRVIQKGEEYDMVFLSKKQMVNGS